MSVQAAEVKIIGAVREMKLWPDALTNILDSYLKVHPCKAEIERIKDPLKYWTKEYLNTVHNTLKVEDRKFMWYYRLAPNGTTLGWTMIAQGLFNGNDFTTHIWASNKCPKNWLELQ